MEKYQLSFYIERFSDKTINNIFDSVYVAPQYTHLLDTIFTF